MKIFFNHSKVLAEINGYCCTNQCFWNAFSWSWHDHDKPSILEISNQIIDQNWLVRLVEAHLLGSQVVRYSLRYFDPISICCHHFFIASLSLPPTMYVAKNNNLQAMLTPLFFFLTCTKQWLESPSCLHLFCTGANPCQVEDHAPMAVATSWIRASKSDTFSCPSEIGKVEQWLLCTVLLGKKLVVGAWPFLDEANHEKWISQQGAPCYTNSVSISSKVSHLDFPMKIFPPSSSILYVLLNVRSYKTRSLQIKDA